MTAIYVALVIYMVVLFGVGLFYSKKNATINDFLLAGRDLGVVAATLTVTASLFGGGLLTGSAQYAYDSGPMMYVYGIVGSGGGLLLAALLVHKMKDFSNYGTITQYLEARYGSRFLRTGSAILSMIALISIVGSQVAAVLAMVVIIALTSMGGLKAVTVTDGFQIILVIIGVIWVTVVALGDVGGFAGLNSALQSMTSELPTDYNVFMTPAHFKTLLWMILPGFMYVMIGQDIYQRLVVVSQIFTVVAGAAAVEGLALLSNASHSLGVGLLALYDFVMTMRHADLTAALVCEALRSTDKAYDPRLIALKNHKETADTARFLRDILSGSAIMDESRSLRVQDSMNTRIIPHVHGIAKRMAGQTYDALMEELYAVFDNPIFLPDGTALMGSNWDATAIELYCDSLAIAVMDVAKLTEVHMERLVDPHLSSLVSMTMLTALQAIDLSDHKAMSPVTQKIHDHARQAVTFMENDDLMYQRIEAMEHLVESNQLLADCSVPFTI